MTQLQNMPYWYTIGKNLPQCSFLIQNLPKLFLVTWEEVWQGEIFKNIVSSKIIQKWILSADSGCILNWKDK